MNLEMIKVTQAHHIGLNPRWLTTTYVCKSFGSLLWDSSSMQTLAIDNLFGRSVRMIKYTYKNKPWFFSTLLSWEV